ncbi:hypothetical protein [Bacillus sp. B-jedd]|uniref:hypothetical protein n=1 Tax=Bacillus sp. B-jedd TaxID=1476857 RepID=UPI0005156F9F|nr:hypothetical protein [Bacillus sp. B-jedd]CEG25666.1 hypothetical protein BN1002_00482 [Bacillus sp. B-jedd]
MGKDHAKRKPVGIILRILVGTAMALMLAGCGLETKTLPEFYGKDLDEVSKIVIWDGSTGYKKKITDKAMIDKFLNTINEIKFIPEENQEKRVGWRYSINLYEKDKRTLQFTLNEVDGHYYYTEPDIHPIVDEFYKNLDVKEE